MRFHIEGRLVAPALSGQSEFREFLFDGLIHVVLAELVGDTDGILDRVSIGPAVANDGDSLDPEQRRAAVLRIIQPPLESAKRILGKDVADLCRQRLLKFLAEHRDERFDQSFTEFQRDVAREPVTNDNVDFAFENVAAFDVADEIDRRELRDLNAPSSVRFLSSPLPRWTASPTRGRRIPNIARE